MADMGAKVFGSILAYTELAPKWMQSAGETKPAHICRSLAETGMATVIALRRGRFHRLAADKTCREHSWCCRSR
jgi:hypothetical protein